MSCCCGCTCCNNDVVFLIDRSAKNIANDATIRTLLDNINTPNGPTIPDDCNVGVSGAGSGCIPCRFGLVTFGDYCNTNCVDTVPDTVNCCAGTQGTCSQTNTCYELKSPLVNDIPKIQNLLQNIQYEGSSPCTC